MRYSTEAEFFCSDFLAQTRYSGTLDPVVTIPTTVTVTNPRSTDPVSVFLISYTSSVFISTSFAPQPARTANPTAFTRPLPIYVQQYPPSRVSSACSCIASPIPTYTITRDCDPSTTSTVSTTITWTTGRPARTTVTYAWTETTLVYASTRAPFPTACPAADGVPYIGSDASLWDRNCDAYFAAVRIPLLRTTTERDFTACIEACVAYNKNLGYNQCQGVLYLPQSGKQCQLGNSVTPGGGNGGQVAVLRFYEPSKPTPNYCATVTGAIGGL